MSQLLLHNCTAHSLDEQDTKYDAVLIEGENIIAVGVDAERRADRETCRLDLQGAHVLPGFVEAHAHIYGMGEKLTKPRLEATRSKEEIYSLLRPLTANANWIVSRGWNQNVWTTQSFPDRFELDQYVSAEVPVALTRIDGHALWCNSRALEIAGIDRTTEDPRGGAILKDRSGEPTGILIDEAMKLVERHIATPAREEMKRTLRAGLAHFVKRGHVEIHEMGVSQELWEAFVELYGEEHHDLPRSQVFLDMTKPTGRAFFLEMFGEGTSSFQRAPAPRLELAGIKLYLDGALGSRGAHLFDDYSDEPGNRGLELMEDMEVIALLRLAAKHELQIAIHAIGDAANARALRLFSESGVNQTNAVCRIEHAQIVRKQELPLFQELGVYALVQPAFFPSDRHWAQERLGARMADAYRWRSLLDAGAVLVGSSDAPIEEPDPLAGIRLLTGRDGVADDEQIPYLAALRAYAQNAHLLTGQRNCRGNIGVGMRADLTVVIPGIGERIDSFGSEILATIVAGRVLHASERLSFWPQSTFCSQTDLLQAP